MQPRKYRPSATTIDVGPPFAMPPSSLASSSVPPVPEGSEPTPSRPTLRWLQEEPWKDPAEEGKVPYMVRVGRTVVGAAMGLFAPLHKKFALAPPIHFNETQVRRVECYARDAGWNGPVLWYIPENVTLMDLHRLEAISPKWWMTEANFPRSMPTVSPYDDAGYWVLGSPIPHPSTLGSCLDEQLGMLPSLAHLLGFRKADIVLGDATDLAVIVSVARSLGLLELEQPLAIRTETCLHLSEAARSWFDHLDVLNVSLVVSSKVTEIGDYPNTARAPFLGITPLLY